MEAGYITITGAREHNLKNINLRLPRNSLIVITGISGSGKSSLAFDTIYAEGQRRYVESLSAYARQFLEQLQKPDVDHIEGLSPAVSIEQRSAGANPRSTVGTITEIYDYLRLLFARIGVPYCYICGRKISSQTQDEILNKILELLKGKDILIIAPVVRGKKGEYTKLFSELRLEGFVRVRVDGRIFSLDEEIKLAKYKKHDIEAVVDRLTLGEGVRNRLADSVETALKVGQGLVIVSELRSHPPSPRLRRMSAEVSNEGGQMSEAKDILFSELLACPKCGISYKEIEPRIFSFNSPYGACKSCGGLGTKMEIDEDLVIPDKTRSLREGAIRPWRIGGMRIVLYYRRLLRGLAQDYNFSLDSPYKDLPRDVKKIILYGINKEEWGRYFEGVIPNLERRFRETDSDFVKMEINKYMSVLPCPECKGARLKPESLSIKISNKSIKDLTAMPISELKQFLSSLELSQAEREIGRRLLKEIDQRLGFMMNVGLDYLTLDRSSATLSGGEAQRIRLATQIGSGLVGVVYILDEPSIGLHQRDNSRLLQTLKSLRDLGNTLIVVEHDEATIINADFLVDLGPGAGKDGGYVVCEGKLDDILNCKESLTAKYLKGELEIKVPKIRRRPRKGNFLKIFGCKEHNLKDIDVKIPLGLFVCITGVSGSGKSTLVDEILYRALAQRLYRSKQRSGKYKRLLGVENIDKVIVIDQSPIGRTPRSNPATYTGVFSYIREIFSKLHESRVRGYKPGRFSFNVKGGRCEACQGDGIKKIEMHFLPDVYIRCEVCKGRRYNHETLQINYKGKSIADVLEMTVEEALDLFKNIPQILNRLQTLVSVGLGYIQLGQSATTLSGGEAQRVKLSTELSHKGTGKTLYILDEPTTGLHFADIEKLLSVLHALVAAGNTVLVIEHNMDVIKTADYIIDLGPEGGEMGGEVVVCGTPEEVVQNSVSYTGAYLKKYLPKFN